VDFTAKEFDIHFAYEPGSRASFSSSLQDGFWYGQIFALLYWFIMLLMTVVRYSLKEK
jgi:hypothetical protein